MGIKVGEGVCRQFQGWNWRRIEFPKTAQTPQFRAAKRHHRPIFQGLETIAIGHVVQFKTRKSVLTPSTHTLPAPRRFRENEIEMNRNYRMRQIILAYQKRYHLTLFRKFEPPELLKPHINPDPSQIEIHFISHRSCRKYKLPFSDLIYLFIDARFASPRHDT